jgi:hypothetical protein
MMNAADTDVRSAGARGRRGAGGARPSLLARSMLRFFEHLLQLDRKLLLLAVAAPMSACVIPVGPEFQDPPGAPNSPPSIVSTDPLAGTIVTIANPHFSITVSDNDVGDDLTVRWILEYPPWSTDHSTVPVTDVIHPAGDGRPVRRPSTFDLGCEGVTRGLTTTHFISAAVSDRGFVGKVATPDDTTPVIATWIWVQNCL